MFMLLAVYVYIERTSLPVYSFFRLQHYGEISKVTANGSRVHKIRFIVVGTFTLFLKQLHRKIKHSHTFPRFSYTIWYMFQRFAVPYCLNKELAYCNPCSPSTTNRVIMPQKNDGMIYQGGCYLNSNTIKRIFGSFIAHLHASWRCCWGIIPGMQSDKMRNFVSVQYDLELTWIVVEDMIQMSLYKQTRSPTRFSIAEALSIFPVQVRS